MHVAICTKDSCDGANTPRVAAKPPETPIIPRALPGIRTSWSENTSQHLPTQFIRFVTDTVTESVQFSKRSTFSDNYVFFQRIFKK